MKQISHETYLMMQAQLYSSGSYTDSRMESECNVALRVASQILKINKTTVANEVTVKPISESAFYRICDDKHEIGDGVEGIVTELKKLGLIKDSK